MFSKTDVDARNNEENVRCGENEKPYICGSLCEPSCDAPHPNRIFCPRIVSITKKKKRYYVKSIT